MYQLNILLLCTETWLSAVGEKKDGIFSLKEVVPGEEIYVNHMYWKKAKTIKSVSYLFLF